MTAHPPAEPAPKAFVSHDHSACRRRALREVEAVCTARGLRLTELRRRVLELLLESHAALGAYDVLERLRAEGRNAQPPVAYRALDFLLSHGFAHRIESLNAFVACTHPDGAHRPAFLICQRCRSVAELRTAPLRAAIAPQAEALGFELDAMMVEARGLCPGCAEPVA